MNDKPVITSPMPATEHRGLTILLAVILAIALLTYAACLFKNISYPLMWADESMTAVGAQRVLDFGYPKVHDGRNVFYDLRHNDMTLGIDKKTDAYIGGAGWAPYYFTAPFVAMSRFATDFYIKTAILRVPFAVAGFAGMLLLLRTGMLSLATRQSRLAVAVFFIILEFPSVTLMLHLREIRYYSLQLLLTATALGLFAAYYLRASIKYSVYAAAVIILVPLLFLTFSPASVAFCVTIFIYLGGEWVVCLLDKRNEKNRPIQQALFSHFKTFVPVIASLLLVAPLAWFFRTLYISRQLDDFYGFTLDAYIEHLYVLLGYFTRYDIFAFVIVAKLLLVFFWRKLRNDAALRPAFEVSLLLSIYFIIHALIVAKIPNDIFTRYFITLQPILVLSFAIDLLILIELAKGKLARRRVMYMAVIGALYTGSAVWAFSQNWQLIKGRIYEISNKYRGELDFVIPYIQEHYEHPERLTIATNYEETSYIYYLGCRVIVGFLNPDFRPDQLEQPDIIIYRSFWSEFTDKNVFVTLLKQGNYEIVRFPVLDYGFNNIPETIHWTPGTGWGMGLHFFGTAYIDNPHIQATLFMRRGVAAIEQPVRQDKRGASINPQPR